MLMQLITRVTMHPDGMSIEMNIAHLAGEIRALASLGDAVLETKKKPAKARRLPS